MKFFHALILVFAVTLLTVGCKNTNEGTDLTTNITGVFSGTLTINLDTDSAQDITNQRLEITKVDDETIMIKPMEYPDTSPVDSISLSASLTRTPFNFIQTKGVMLTIAKESYSKGTIEGTPFSFVSGSDPNAHGKYDQETGELIYALQIFRDGVDHYELFIGNKQ